MFPGPTEFRLIGCSIDSIWTPNIKIKYIDTKNQLADILTTGNFTRDKWNHLLCLFEISHFSSTVCSEAMAKKSTTRFRRRASHSEIATNDESYCKGSLESVIFGVRKPGEEKFFGNQNPWSAIAEKNDRTGQPFVGSDPRTAPGYYHKQFTESSFSARYYSKWDGNKTWSSQEWEAVESMDYRTGQPLLKQVKN